MTDFICIDSNEPQFNSKKENLLLLSNDITYKYIDENEIVFSFPKLLKKKNNRVEKEYLYSLANIAFKKVVDLYNIKKQDKRVVVFEYEIRNSDAYHDLIDYDNVELSVIINALVNYFLIDDSPTHYSLYCTSKNISDLKGPEETKKTNIYILSKDRYFKKFMQEEVEKNA